MRKILIVIAALLAAAAVVVAAAASARGPAPDPAQDANEEDFVPSERLPADSAISFPVDI